MAAGGNRDGEKRGWRSQADSGFLGLRPADLGGSRSEVAAAAGPQKQEAQLEEARRGLEVDQFLEDVRLQERTTGYVGRDFRWRGRALCDLVLDGPGIPARCGRPINSIFNK